MHLVSSLLRFFSKGSCLLLVFICIMRIYFITEKNKVYFMVGSYTTNTFLLDDNHTIFGRSLQFKIICIQIQKSQLELISSLHFNYHLVLCNLGISPLVTRELSAQFLLLSLYCGNESDVFMEFVLCRFHFCSHEVAWLLPRPRACFGLMGCWSAV